MRHVVWYYDANIAIDDKWTSLTGLRSNDTS